MTRNPLPLTRYLFTRLAQCGVHAVHGVPGDFTLKALDHLTPAGIKWLGTANELNAGYAADGYARIRGLGALCTTYGVGELSAFNALAGSFAEHVPVVQVVGAPARELQRRCANVHHTLGDGKPRVFAELATHVTVAQANLMDVETAPADIDRVLETCLHQSRPGYVELPCDMVSAPVDGERLARPLCSSIRTNGPDEEKENEAMLALLERLYRARQPLLLVDSGDGVRRSKAAINAFVQASGIPTLSMPSGNGMVEHALKNFYGVHSGPVGQIDTMPYVSKADLVVAFGPMFSDTQTLGWKVVPDAEKVITLGKNYIQFPSSGCRSSIDLEHFLSKLTQSLDPSKLYNSVDVSSLGDFRTIQPRALTGENVNIDRPIDQTSFYLCLSAYLRPHDVVLLANATPILGGRDLVLPTGAQIISSGQWFSVGHMLPAAVGVSLAKQNDPESRISRSRTILLDGDGSFQATAQELGTAIRYRLPLTIFLINNAGYAYERQIHGMHADYNDLAPWRYDEAVWFFGGYPEEVEEERKGEGGNDGEYPVKTYIIRTWRDLQTLLADEQFCDERGMKFVDVRMGKFDVPEKFRVVFQRAGEQLG